MLLRRHHVLSFPYSFRSFHFPESVHVSLPREAGLSINLRAGSKRDYKICARVKDQEEIHFNEDIMIDSKIKILFLTSSKKSFFGPSWQEILEHISQRLQWTNSRFNPVVSTLDTVSSSLKDPSLVVFIGVDDVYRSQTVVEELAPAVVLVFDSFEEMKSLISIEGFNPVSPSWLESIQLLLPWSKLRKTCKAYQAMETLWNRQTSEDLVYLFQFAVNQFLTDLPEMSDLEPDFQAIKCIGQNCRKQVLRCLQDPECKKALDCLNSCGMNDQVCSYRCIASYESKLLEEFSLCILQKHNCLRKTASIPLLPEVNPMEEFRGEPLTFTVAEDIFIGRLGEAPWSWKVAYGKNPAYDYFPCQFQLFYRGKARNSMWYDPVFKVITLDGRAVWRRRHYKVRRASKPGCFYFSVLDNGVTSNEYWRIVDADDDLSWALFYYSGAASTAGISYTGAVLGTYNGALPHPSQEDRIQQALERCGIKQWEISAVDNSSCEDPPIDISPKIASTETMEKLAQLTQL